MVDAVGSVAKIVEVALQIKQAVDTVHQNEEDCIQIGKRVTMLSAILSKLENKDTVRDPAMKALHETLNQAYKLVKDCQEEKNVVSIFFNAGKMSKQLRKVNDDILAQAQMAIANFGNNGLHPAPAKDPEQLGFATLSHEDEEVDEVSDPQHDASDRLEANDETEKAPAVEELSRVPKIPPASLPWFTISTYSQLKQATNKFSSVIGRGGMALVMFTRKAITPLDMGDKDSEQKALVDILANPSAEAKELPFSLLEDITAKFSKEREIGGGSFGVVYKGELRNGMKVAVKRLKWILDDNKFYAEFYAEVDCLKKLKNKNIVRLLGYCVHIEIVELMVDGKKVPVETNRERLLCFEFVPHGTVQKAGPHGAEWPKRYQIIKGICHGLEYIHNAEYLHLDLKPDNILLGENMEPKITDFGVSRFFGEQHTHDTMRNSGTWGYMAPEYVDMGTVSKKADIYSLGVVIFELVTGSKGPDVYESTQEQKDIFLEKALLDWNRSLCKSHRGRSLELAYQQVETCIKIALNCTDINRDLRRPIKEIAHILDLALDPYILDAHTTEAVLVKHFGSLEDMDVHPNEPWVLLSLSSGSIEILNCNSKESMEPFKLSEKPVHSAKFMEGIGWNIVAGDDHGVMHVYHFRERTYKQFKSIMATADKGIRSLAVHPSKPYVLLSTGSSIMIWNTEDWTCIRMHHGPGYFKTVTRATFNTNDDRAFGIGCCDGTVKLWSHASLTSARRPYLVLRDHSEQVCSIDYFTCDSVMFLVTGSMDKTAKVWKYSEEPTCVGFGLASITKPEATLKHADGVTATCYNPELKIIITGTNDGAVSVWCSQTYRRKRLLCFGLGRICALACLRGRRVFIGHEHGLVLVETDLKQLCA